MGSKWKAWGRSRLPGFDLAFGFEEVDHLLGLAQFHRFDQQHGVHVAVHEAALGQFAVLGHLFVDQYHGAAGVLEHLLNAVRRIEAVYDVYRVSNV